MNSYEIPLNFLWIFQKRIEKFGRLGMVVISVSTISSLVAPVDSWFIPLFIGFQPSKVVQDFATTHSSSSKPQSWDPQTASAAFSLSMPVAIWGLNRPGVGLGRFCI
jgi:hypothetical protein